MSFELVRLGNSSLRLLPVNLGVRVPITDQNPSTLWPEKNSKSVRPGAVRRLHPHHASDPANFRGQH